MKKQRVGVLMGGMSAEREVSLRTGEGVAAALESRGHDVVRIVLGSRRRAASTSSCAEPTSTSRSSRCTGAAARTAASRGCSSCSGIPYTGSSVLAIALAMDKLKAKEMFRLHNVPTPPVLRGDDAPTSRDLEEIHGSFGFPVIVKPRGEGSSVGVAQGDEPGRAGARRSTSALAYDDVRPRRALRARRWRSHVGHPRRPRPRRASRSRRRAASTTTRRSTRPG